jgi:bla regulator protein BlaR1
MEVLSSFLEQPIFYSLSVTLLHFIWQGVVIALGLHLFLKLSNDKQSDLRYAGSLLAMTLNLIVPLITFTLIFQSQNNSPVSTVIANSIGDFPIIANQDLSGFQAEWRTLVPFISLAWLIGVLYFSLHLIVEMFKVYQLPRAHTTSTSTHIQVMFDRISRQLNVTKAARLVISLKADVPMVVGWLKPVVLLPLSMSSGLTIQQLEMLLTHELAHIKRHDYLINFIQTLVEVVMFYHPCVKWVSKQVRAEREYCCDDIAIHHCGNALAYANALTDAEMLRPHTIPQLALAASGGNLKNRIFRAVGHENCTPKNSGQGLASLFSFALVIFIFTGSQVAGIATFDENALLDKLNNKTKPDNEKLLNTIKPTTASKASKKEKKRIEIAKLTNIKKNSTTDVTQKPATLNQDKTVKSKNSNQNKIKKFEKASKKLTLKKPIINTNMIIEQQPAKLISKRLKPQVSSNFELVVENKTDRFQIASLDTMIIPIIEQSNISKAIIQDSPVQEGPIKIAPKLIKSSAPNYPSKAINKNLSGEFMVTFVVSTGGRVKDVEFAGKVHISFKRSIRKALRKWQFEPGTLNGNKAEMQLSKSFIFTEPPNWATKSTGSRIEVY